MPQSTQALILIPTPLELEHVQAAMETSTLQHRCVVEVCGFGVAASSAKTMQLILHYNPTKLILMGIAGSYMVDDSLVGSAFQFREVAIHGIGIGDGPKFQSAGDAGWLHWRANKVRPVDAANKSKIATEDIGDRIKLSVADDDDFPTQDLLLTVCGASRNQADKETRLRSYANAACEDMEGFGVALAAKMSGVKLQIIRGISNEVGNRDFKQWKTELALQAAWQLVEQSLQANKTG